VVSSLLCGRKEERKHGQRIREVVGELQVEAGEVGVADESEDE